MQEFINDGTLASHMLLPGLRVVVRKRATELPWPDSGQYEHVDAVINQYRVLDRNIEDYALAEAERAELPGLDIINGLNIADGGDGPIGSDYFDQPKLQEALAGVGARLADGDAP